MPRGSPSQERAENSAVCLHPFQDARSILTSSYTIIRDRRKSGVEGCTGVSFLPGAQEEAGLKGCLCYEDLIEAERQHLKGFQWVRVDENDACGLCYTSGTTGKPKVRCAL